MTIAALVITSSWASADYNKKEIRMDDCPAPVREVITANSRDGKIDDVDMIDIDGKQIYIAEVDLPRDTDLKVYVSGEGVLIKTREDVRDGDVPASVTNAVKDLGTIDDVEKETKGETVTYHVDIDRSGQADLEVVLSESGEVLSKSEGSDD